MIDTAIILSIAYDIQENVNNQTALTSVKSELTTIIQMKEKVLDKINAEILEQYNNCNSSSYTNDKLYKVSKQLVSIRTKYKENNDNLDIIEDNLQTLTLKMYTYLHNHFINN